MRVDKRTMRDLLALMGRLVVVLGVALFGGWSCEDGGSESPIVGTWLVTKMEHRKDLDPWRDVTSENLCRLEQREEFRNDGRWVLYPGPCGTSATPSYGTWELRAGAQILVFVYDLAIGEYLSTVELLTDSEMILWYNAGDLGNNQYRYSYAKQ